MKMVVEMEKGQGKKKKKMEIRFLIVFGLLFTNSIVCLV